MSQLDYVLLATLHRMLKQIAELNDQLESCPRMVKMAERKQAESTAALAAVKDELVKAKLLSHEKQVQLKQREAKIENHKSKRNSCESNREYQILSEQIEADLKANEVQSDEILELLERIDRLEQQVVEAKEAAAAGEKETRRVKELAEAKAAGLRQEIARVQEELKQEEAKLPGDLAGEYRRLTKSAGEEALAESEGEACGRCHQVFTAQTRSELYQRKIVFCRSCGSLLYLSERLLATLD